MPPPPSPPPIYRGLYGGLFCDFQGSEGLAGAARHQHLAAVIEAVVALVEIFYRPAVARSGALPFIGNPPVSVEPAQRRADRLGLVGAGRELASCVAGGLHLFGEGGPVEVALAQVLGVEDADGRVIVRIRKLAEGSAGEGAGGNEDSGGKHIEARGGHECIRVLLGYRSSLVIAFALDGRETVAVRPLRHQIDAQVPGRAVRPVAPQPHLPVLLPVERVLPEQLEDQALEAGALLGLRKGGRPDLGERFVEDAHRR